ncbi:MAG: hypothetical protein J1E56_02785 [Ruminococcus sp.]|nr:hypothetical protein [Ruminococcus sp.]
MIIFENDKFLKNVKKNGVSGTDQYAKFKINYVMEDMVFNSSYRKNKIIEKVKSIAKQYFYGLPDNFIDKELEILYESAKEKINDEDSKRKHENKIITLYDSEMKTIEALRDDELMRLAFATLILHKFCGQYLDGGVEKYRKYVDTCEADAYRVAGLDKVSGTKKDKLWKKLYDKNMIDYWLKNNYMWQYKPEWIAKRLFTVPYNVDLKSDKHNEDIFKRITNYDNVLLYLKYWLKDGNVTACMDCGCPIDKGTKAKKLCSNCASIRKKSSDKARYNRNVAIT